MLREGKCPQCGRDGEHNSNFDEQWSNSLYTIHYDCVNCKITWCDTYKLEKQEIVI